MEAVILATTLRDPAGRLARALSEALPQLSVLFSAIIVQAAEDAHPAGVEILESHGALVEREAPLRRGIGRARLDALSRALASEPDVIMASDLDRVIHWAATYPAELKKLIGSLPASDVTVIGRSSRAFGSHPAPQRETERIVNLAFQRVTGRHWDVVAAARGFSARAASVLVRHAPDIETVATDVAWLLCLLDRARLSFTYVEADGLEYETPDRLADEIALAGGLQGWRVALEADPRQWLHRLNAARLEIEALEKAIRP